MLGHSAASSYKILVVWNGQIMKLSGVSACRAHFLELNVLVISWNYTFLEQCGKKPSLNSVEFKLDLTSDSDVLIWQWHLQVEFKILSKNAKLVLLPFQLHIAWSGILCLHSYQNKIQNLILNAEPLQWSLKKLVTYPLQLTPPFLGCWLY